MPICAIHAYVKQILKTLLLHPDLKKLFRKPIRKVVTARIIPEVRFLHGRAGYKREHHKLAYNKKVSLLVTTFVFSHRLLLPFNFLFCEVNHAYLF
jgi:hypothetical protein